MTYGLMLGSCIFCTVLTLAVYALLARQRKRPRERGSVSADAA